jgi:hypothetical protein
MADIPTIEPSSANAGDTWRWTRTLADYPASAGWALSYTLINAAAKITINATASGDDHAVTVAAATTGGYAAGTYDWRARVTRTGEVFTMRPYQRPPSTRTMRSCTRTVDKTPKHHERTNL